MSGSITKRVIPSKTLGVKLGAPGGFRTCAHHPSLGTLTLQ